MHSAGQAAQPVPAEATYTLTIGDARLSTRTDCNVCNGTLSLTGQTVTAGPLFACTRAACRTGDFEHAYTHVLGGEATAIVSGSMLRLSSERGVLDFAR
jgi:heat shock protein HslJ